MNAVVIALVALAAAPLDWQDVDGDGLDGRVQVIAERCSGGLCLDQYTGLLIADSEVEVDHILPRKRAEELFENGRAEWRAFVNWPGNLATTAKQVNRAKGARGPETFCPARAEARAWYAERYAATARHFNLKLRPSEELALDELRAGRCADGGN